MEGYKTYRRKKTTGFMRPYTPGDSLEGIGINDHDTGKGYHLREGSYVAIDPDNPSDKWFVNEDYFNDTFEPDPID